MLWQLKREKLAFIQKQKLLFSHNKKSVSPIFLQNLILPAVAIKLYWFKLIFKQRFYLNNRPFVFSIIDNNFDSGCHSNKICNEAKFLCQVLTACKDSKKSNRRLLRYCTFIFALSYSIASVTSYLLKMKLKTYKMAMSILPKFLTLKWNISRTIWLIEVGDGSFLAFFHALSFELNFFSTGGSL